METVTPLRVGDRLRSQVCSTQVVVVRVGPEPVMLTCGGFAMVPLDVAPSGESPRPGLDTGTQIGKRYVAGATELLVTAAGAGTLADGDRPLSVRATAPLPASD